MALSDFIRRQREMEAARGNLTPGEWSHRLRGEPTWDWGGSGRYVPEGPIPEDSWQRRQKIMPPNDAFTPNPPMSSLDWKQLALSENLPPAAGYGDIYDQMGETNRRNRGLGGLLRRVNPFDNAQPPPPVSPYGEAPLPRPRPPIEQQYRDNQPFNAQPWSMDDYLKREGWTDDPAATTGTHGGPTDLIAPPDKPQQDTQSVAAVFGPQSGAQAMAEDPRGNTSRRRYEAARIAREAFSRDPSLVKEFLPKLRDAGVDPSLGAPEGWSLPEAPETWQTPGFGTETEAERAARRAEQEAAYRRDLFPPGTGIPGPAVPGGPRPGEPAVMPPRQSAGPANPFAGLSPDYKYGGIGAGITPGNFGRAPQARPEEFGPSQPTPFAGNMPRPRPDGIPAQFADLRNGPRDISRGLIAGGQESRLPLPRPDYAPPAFAGNMPRARPDMPGDVAALSPDQRIAPFTGPAPPISPELAAGAARATRPTDPFLTGLPAQGAIDQTAQRAPASPIDPAAIAEARRTLQLHPDTGRIRTAPGFQQFNEPARTRPVPAQAEAPLIRPDLTQAAANYQPPRLPQARPDYTPPPIEEMGSDLPPSPPIPGAGSLPASVMESIRASYNPTASGGPEGPVDPLTAAAERLAAERRRQLGGTYSPTDDLIAKPASVPPIEPVTLGPAAPETAGMATSAPLIAPPATTPINPRLSPREIEQRARERGFGTVENLTGDRIARGVGAGLGAVGGLVVGGLPGAATFGGIGYRTGDDARRSYMNRTGPFGILGNIFGLGRRLRDRDKDKPLPANGTPPSREPAGVRESVGRSGSGLGSDRGNYGYSTGGRDIIEGVGGRYGQR